MELLNNLYKIIEQGDNCFRVTLNTECLIYKAHFPEQPITPGVCIIQIASELLNMLFCKGLELRDVVNAKFLSVINPIETAEVVYAFTKVVKDDGNNTMKVNVTVSSERAVCAKLSLRYAING